MQKMIQNILFMAIFFALALPPSVGAEENEFVILPGDMLHINVWKEDGMDQEVLVLPDGTITFPLIGTLSARNISPADLQQEIRNKLQPLIPDATVTVSVKEPLGHKVSVIGQVEEPGEVILSTQMGVMQVLSQVGGLTPYADEDKIIILRKSPSGEKEKIVFPYSAIVKGKDLERDIDIIPGDVVVVPASSLF